MNANLFAQSKRRLVITGLISLLSLILLVGSIGIIGWQTTKLELLYQDLYSTARQKENLLITIDSGRTVVGARERLASAFVASSDLAKMIERLESTGRSAKINLEITGADVGVEVGSGVNLSLQLNGSFVNIYRFLRLLEVLPYKLRFDDLSISATGVDWSGNLNLTLLSFLPNHVEN